MEIILYCIASYIIILGMIVNDYEKSKDVPSIVILMWFLSPLSLLFIFGALISNKLKSYRNEDIK